MATKITPTRTEKDPTGQAGNRLRAKAEISRRVRSTRDAVIDVLNRIPVESVTVNKASYQYQIDPQRLTTLTDEIEYIICKALELDDYATSWFMNEYIGKAWQDGTTKAFTRLKTIAESAAPDIAAVMDLDGLLASTAYTRRFEVIAARAFEDMRGFAGQASSDLGFVLGQGVALGQSPRTIAADIRKTFDKIEGYRALRIARTEVNNAFKEARYEESKDVRDRLGLEVRTMHVSALVDNTRPTHAARHGKIYTLEEEREWQHEGSNMINCLCSTVEVVYVNGKPTQEKLIERQRQRGLAFFAMHPEKVMG